MSTPACRFCRHVNPVGAKFCNECGSPLHLRPCPSCEAITDAAAQNCHQCGASFNDDTAVAPAVAAAPSGETAVEAPSRASDAKAASAPDAFGGARHVPEFFADRLDASLDSRGPFKHAGGGSAEGADPGWREPVSARHVAIGDGEEIIADDALARIEPASDRPAVVEEASAAVVDTNDDRHFVGARSSASAPDMRFPRDAGAMPPILIPDAADRPARARPRRNALHPAAWLVVLAALAGGGYYAYDQGVRLLPGLDEVAAIARSTMARLSETTSATQRGAGQDPASATPGNSPPPATASDVATPAPGGARSPAAAPGNDARTGTRAASDPATEGDPKTQAGMSSDWAADDARTQSGTSAHSSPSAARSSATGPAGDAATAQRAAENSRAPPAPDMGTSSATPSRGALPAATAKVMPKSAPKRSGKPKPVAGADVTNAAKVDSARPPSADALATRRLIERELATFPPQDARRTAHEAPAVTD